jgi:predicted helicase
VDNISDAILDNYQKTVGNEISKQDIFYYVYGVLHSPQYRQTFSADLKKTLPHIPNPHAADEFIAFARAGRQLAQLHIGYETVEPYPLAEHVIHALDDSDRELWRVTKMQWRSKADRSAIVYNSNITLTGIPDDAHRYTIGSRSALDWLIDRYRVTTDNASGIINDPNDWCEEHGDPRYIIELIKRVTTVSAETMKIVDALPSLDSSADASAAAH